jgi:phosphatidylglycerophosphate synthase
MLKSTKTAEKASGMLGKLLGWVPFDPNTITLTSVFVAVMAVFSFSSTLTGKLSALMLFLIAFALDAVDGAVARAKNKASNQGAFIDGIADRIVEFCLLITILMMFPLNTEMQLVIFSILFFGTCMTAFVKAYAEHRGVMKHEQAAKLPGLLERAERSVLLLAAFVLLIAGYGLYGIYVLYLVAGLSLITFLQRFFTVLYGKKE